MAERKTKKEDTKWVAEDEQILVDTLKKAREKGLQSDNGFKPTAWQMVVDALVGSETTSGGVQKTLATVKSRWQRVRLIKFFIIQD